MSSTQSLDSFIKTNGLLAIMDQQGALIEWNEVWDYYLDAALAVQNPIIYTSLLKESDKILEEAILSLKTDQEKKEIRLKLVNKKGKIDSYVFEIVKDSAHFFFTWCETQKYCRRSFRF